MTARSPEWNHFVAARQAGCPIEQTLAFASYRIVLQPKQLRASALARTCDHPDGPTEIAYGGARGGGKSHWALAQLTDDCLRFPGLTCLFLRKVGKSARESLEELRRKVLAFVPHEYIQTRGQILFPNGSRIILGHFQSEGDIDAYLGLEYDVIGQFDATSKQCLRGLVLGPVRQTVR